MITKTLTVEGMSCMHCAARVKKILTSVKGVKDAAVELSTGACTVMMKKDIPNEELKSAVESAGFRVTDIK